MTASSHIQVGLDQNPQLVNWLQPQLPDDFGIPLHMQKPHQITLHSLEKSEITSPKPLLTYVASFLGVTAQV